METTDLPIRSPAAHLRPEDTVSASQTADPCRQQRKELRSVLHPLKALACLLKDQPMFVEITHRGAHSLIKGFLSPMYKNDGGLVSPSRRQHRWAWRLDKNSDDQSLDLFAESTKMQTVADTWSYFKRLVVSSWLELFLCASWSYRIPLKHQGSQLLSII